MIGIRKLSFFLFIIALGLLQTAVFDYFKFFGIKPDLLLISAVIASLYFELRWAFCFGITAGIFKDIFSVKPIGVNSLLFPVWIFLVIKLSKEISLDNIFIRVALIFIVVAVNNMIARLILLFFGDFMPVGIFLRITFLESLYTAIVSFLIFRIAGHSYKR